MREFISRLFKKETMESDFHSNFKNNKFVKIFWQDSTTNFLTSVERINNYSKIIKKYLVENDFPKDSFRIAVDKIKNICAIEADHQYIDGEIFLKLFDCGCGIKDRILPSYNFFTGIVYLFYHIPRLVSIYLKDEVEENLTREENNISLNKVYKVNYKKEQDVSKRALTLYTLYEDIRKSVNKDVLNIGIPVPFSSNEKNNVGIGIIVFDKNITPKILESRLKYAYTMAVATNMFDRILRSIPLTININARKFRENIDIISTIFYYDGTGEADTNFNFRFLPGKEVIEKMYISACTIKKDDALELNACITTCYKDYAAMLNKNSDYKYIDN
jgi:hypothetical protein